MITRPLPGEPAPAGCLASTKDALLGGKITLHQPARGHGYRVNVDALLLASFAMGVRDPASEPRRFRHVVDLGAGVGAIGLMLLHFGVASSLTMIECAPDLCELARRNIRENGHDHLARVLCHDVILPLPEPLDRADLVVCNPPYFVPGRGRTPEHPARARGREGSVDAFIETARHVAGRLARVCFVYPAADAVTLFSKLRAHGLEPKRVRFVHGKPCDPARIVLVSAMAGKPGGLVVEPAFVEMDQDGRETPALSELLQRR